MSETLTLSRTDFDTEVDERVREHEEIDYSGWVAVATSPFPCPASGCDFVALHMTAAHLILVWPDRDDGDLLARAQEALVAKRNPRVVEWRPELGPCLSYWRWVSIGQPVHGMVPREQR